MPYSWRQLLAAGLCLCGFASAQGVAPDPRSTNRALSQPESDAGAVRFLEGTSVSVFQSFGLGTLDGELVGGGPDYRVEFEANRFVYTPAMPSAPRMFPVSMRVSGYGRGSASRSPSRARLTAGEQVGTVSYLRPEFVENYQLRRDGVKQDFTFADLPPGEGDLVVSVLVETDLRLASERGPRGELQLLHEHHGGVMLGEVVGIDADGVRVNGSLQWTAGKLELRLPASFVDRATLPIVLDPFVGTVIGLGSANSEDFDADVAFDATIGRYLVTWSRQFSVADVSVRAAMLTKAGTVATPLITLESSGRHLFPRCANVGTRDAFAVVYQSNNDIVARGILAATSVVGPRITMAGGVDVQVSPDVGGEYVADDDVVVVWHNASSNEIEAQQFFVTNTSPPTIGASGSVVTVGAASVGSAIVSNATPEISKSGGTTGRHCIVWGRTFQSSQLTSVYARIVDRNVQIESAELLVSGSGDSDFPAVDGNGQHWVVAWETEPTPGSGDNDVEARSVGWSLNLPAGARGYVHSAIADIESNINDDERGAQVAWVGDSALVFYEDAAGPGVYDVFIQPVDVFSCFDCGTRLVLPASVATQHSAPAASRSSGGDSGDGALIVWHEGAGGAGRNARAIRYRADDGISESLGGGCGAEGTVYAGCAVNGNSYFVARVRDSWPSSTAWFVVSPDQLGIGCGLCTLIANPFTGFVIPTSTDSLGNASFAVSLPSGSAMVGMTFIHQWLIFDASSPGCPSLGTDLSDAQKTEIQ